MLLHRFNRSQSTFGFTLIELAVVLAIVAILAAIAYPSFADQMRRSRRVEAIAGLQQIQLLEEKYRVNHTTYGSLADIGAASTSEHSYYTFSISGQNAGSYTATATAQGLQAGDTKCATLSLAYATGTTSKTSTPTGNTCWN